MFYYFCSAFGPIVQWIEFQIPVLTIWVRIPMGSQKKKYRDEISIRHGIFFSGLHNRCATHFSSFDIFAGTVSLKQIQYKTGGLMMIPSAHHFEQVQNRRENCVHRLFGATGRARQRQHQRISDKTCHRTG